MSGNLANLKTRMESVGVAHHGSGLSLFLLVESLFNRRVEEKAKEMLFTPLGWHHSSLDQLREENGEKKAMERLL